MIHALSKHKRYVFFDKLFLSKEMNFTILSRDQML
jgi:hypothetical protein